MNTLVKVNIGDFTLSLPQGVAEVWTNDIDGIMCASALMEYRLDILNSSHYASNSKDYSVLMVSFYKEQDFYFEVRFTYKLKNNLVTEIQLYFNENFYPPHSLQEVAQKTKLTINKYYNFIEVKSEEQMQSIFEMMRFLL